MLAHAELQRSIRAMTLGLSKAMQTRQRWADPYRLAEREQQFQYELTGQVGFNPVETDITFDFDLIFIGDSGNQRDSTLDRPQVRFGFEEEYGPPGLITYAKVVSWGQDDDFNYRGATVRVGVHCPLVATEGMNVTEARFKLALHVGFQGWGAIYDPEGNYDAGGNVDIPDWSGTTH